MAENNTIQTIYQKIEVEKALINAAHAMRSKTGNEVVQSRLDNQIHDARRNIQYFEQLLQDQQLRRMTQATGNMSVSGPPVPPPKDDVDPGNFGGGPTFQRPPFASTPGSAPKKANFSKLGELLDVPGVAARNLSERVVADPKSDLIRYDTPHLGPRIQHMLSQLQFKLNIEEQYLRGVEKMVQLYSMEGDRKSKADAAARKLESRQKVILLKQALKRYEQLHIDIEQHDQDGSSNNRLPINDDALVAKLMAAKR